MTLGQTIRPKQKSLDPKTCFKKSTKLSILKIGNQAVYFLVCLGMNHQKSAQKSITFRNINFENSYSLQDLEQIFAGKYIKINLKTKERKN